MTLFTNTIIVIAGIFAGLFLVSAFAAFVVAIVNVVKGAIDKYKDDPCEGMIKLEDYVKYSSTNLNDDKKEKKKKKKDNEKYDKEDCTPCE